MFRSEEQAEFHSVIAARIKSPDLPLLLEGATGLGKTRAFLKAVFETNKQVAVCLATNQLIDQLVSGQDFSLMQETFPSRTIAVFRSRKHFEDDDGIVDRTAYEDQKLSALNADIVICTASSVIFDQRLDGNYNGVYRREVIVFDEADQIPSLAALASNLSLERQTLGDFNCTASTPLKVADKLLSVRNLDQEHKAKAKIVREIANEPKVWYKRVGMTDDGGVSVVHRLAGRLLKKISNQPSTIFISATLSVGGKFDDFRRTMGLRDISPLSRIIEPKQHGTLVLPPFKILRVI